MTFLPLKRSTAIGASLVVALVASACPVGARELDLSDTSPDVAGYDARIVPLLRAYCLDCHDDSVREGDFSLEGLSPDMITEEANIEAWRMIRERVAFGEMPPEDASQPTDDERKALLDWITGELRKGHLPGAPLPEKLSLPQYGNYVDHDALFGARLDRVYPPPPRLWRLRPDIYDATLPRLGERVSGLANGLNELDDPEFKDYASAYFIDEAATTPLLGNAKKIAAALLSERSKDREFKRLVEDEGPPSAEQVDQAIGHAFRKILDRNPTAAERQRFAAFYENAKQTGGYKIAANALLTAVLMQPEVLFRQELGDGKLDEFGRMRLSQREIAFALSYALDNQPVREFFNAAENGELATREQIAEVVREHLKDDSLLQNKNPRVLQFFREYFNYPFAREVFKDTPEGGTHDADRLVEDLETTIRDILRADEDVLAELLTTREYYVDSKYKENKQNKIALHKGHHKWSFYHTAYSLPRDWKWAAEIQPIEFPEDERAGVLTHPGWLVAWSGNFENHPVQRGKWIRTHLLGGSVPDVPIGVDARVPEKEHTTFRDRLKMATSDSRCWRCHKKMDPLGVAFERYDHYGRYQRFDAGQPVDASGLVARTGVDALDGRKVDGPTEMVDLLARSEYVQQVFVRHAFRYFMGRNETLGDANTLQDAHRAYREGGGSFRELVVSLLSSDSFLLRQPTNSNRSQP